jgi:diadenosine tetraphosphatase ApaH/serine/threonine PP2A family protein phosphatase
MASARGTCLTRETIFTSRSVTAASGDTADVLACLYDIHGSLPALEAVLADADAAGAERYLLGGDYGAWGPHPLECVGLLRTLPHTTWIRGNGERWVREPPFDRPEVVEALKERRSGYGSEEGWLFSLQAQCELDGVLYVHGSPLSDVDSFSPDPEDDDERMLAGVRDQTVVFGHSHLQFRRPGSNGTTLVNPGSVGMPLDGDVRAAYAIRREDGDFEFRRVEYDVERAAAAYDALGGGFAKMAAQRIRRGSD